jgi:hypothetical protein
MDLPLSMRLAAGDRFIGDLQRCTPQGGELNRKNRALALQTRVAVSVVRL